MTLGASTNTQDRWGQVLEEKPVTVSREEIDLTIQSFIGDIWQVPPMFSALKVKGQKLVDLARQGVEVEREPRLRTIYDIQVHSIEGNMVWMDITCAKGTYIRTLCHDIGQRLGCGAHMSFLLRTKTGSFKLENTITVEQLKAHKEASVVPHLVDMGSAVGEWSQIDVPEHIAARICNGIKLDLATWLKEEPLKGARYRVYSKGAFLGIAQCHEKAYPEIRMEKLLLNR